MKIGEYLSEHKVPFVTHEHAAAYTAQQVAAQEHVSGHILAKTVLVRDEKGYALCVLPACFKLDLGKVAALRRTREVQLADEDELAWLFPDVEVGAEPPFGNLYDLPTLVDEHLSEHEEIVFQAGTHRESVRMKYADYARLVLPTVEDMSVRL